MSVVKNIKDNSIRSKMKIAIVGAGGRTTTFLNYFSQHPSEGEVVGISDVIPEKAELLLKYYKINAQVFKDTEKMLDTVKPDAVIICTPDFAHVEPSVLALKQKIHVLCEKPMSTTLEDCDKIIEAAKNLPRSSISDSISDMVRSTPPFTRSSLQAGSVRSPPLKPMNIIMVEKPISAGGIVSRNSAADSGLPKLATISTCSTGWPAPILRVFTQPPVYLTTKPTRKGPSNAGIAKFSMNVPISSTSLPLNPANGNKSGKKFE